MSKRINEGITSLEVDLIGEKGERLGVLPRNDAIRIAKSKSLDLVQMSDAKIPICKLLDYSKEQFLRKKKLRQSKSKDIKKKEIRMTQNIGSNDYEVKMRKACQFLEDGNEITIVVYAVGRLSAESVMRDKYLKVKEYMKNTYNIDPILESPKDITRCRRIELTYRK